MLLIALLGSSLKMTMGPWDGMGLQYGLSNVHQEENLNLWDVSHWVDRPKYAEACLQRQHQ